MKQKIYSFLLFLILTTLYIISLFYIRVGSNPAGIGGEFVLNYITSTDVLSMVTDELFTFTNSNPDIVRSTVIVSLLFVLGTWILFGFRNIKMFYKHLLLMGIVLGFAGTILLLQTALVFKGVVPCGTIIFKCTRVEKTERNTTGKLITVNYYKDYWDNVLTDYTFGCSYPDYYDTYKAALQKVASWELTNNVQYTYQFDEDDSVITIDIATMEIDDSKASTVVKNKITQKIYEGTSCDIFSN